MKAAICEKYGSPDVIKVKEVPAPQVEPGEVLIKVMASAVNTMDVRLRSLSVGPLMGIMMRFMMGITKPKQPILGANVAGEIVALGEGVESFKIGDQVFGVTGMSFGGHAQYIAMKEARSVALKPKNALYEEAAVLPFGGTSALFFLRKAEIGVGQEVMIYGASGAVGTAGVQVAKYLGATVTAVCSKKNFDLIGKLGAQTLLEYQNDAYKKTDKKYDIIFDAVGKIKKSKVKKMLKPGGRFISVDGDGIAGVRKADLQLLAQMYEEGKLKAVIDRTFTLDEIAAAHRYVDQGTKTGNVALLIKHD